MANIYNSQLDAFSLYHQIQESAQPSSQIGPALPALGHALAGSTGTAISNLAIYPLDLIITRLQVQRAFRETSTIPHDKEYKGVIDAFQKIYKEGGISNFYEGVLQDTGKSIADSFLFFLFYNYLRETRRAGNGGGKLAMFDELAVGAIAGGCSKFFTTPISNIVTRKQTASMLSSSKSPTVSEIAREIRATKGIQGFWSGYSASLVLTLNPSLTFFLYEFFTRTLVPRAKRDDPGARLTFLMAAVSKAIASTVTYPFALAKTRAQASSKPPVRTEEAVEIKDEVSTASDKEDAKKAGKHASKVAKRSTVFAAILKIYRDEGLPALYEGVGGEIVKGFFSHGITMLVKEAVHKVIIQLYFFILKALGKMPSREELQSQAEELASQAGDKVKGAGERVSEMVANVSESAGNIMTDASDKVKNGYAAVGGKVEGAAEAGKNQIASAGEKVSDAGNNATAAVKSTNELASQEAGHLLGNAQQMLGGKIPGVKDEE